MHAHTSSAQCDEGHAQSVLRRCLTRRAGATCWQVRMRCSLACPFPSAHAEFTFTTHAWPLCIARLHAPSPPSPPPQGGTLHAPTLPPARRRTFSEWLMPGRSLKGSGKSMLNALLVGCLNRIFTAVVPVFFSVSCLEYSVPAAQCRHSSCSGQSRLNLRVQLQEAQVSKARYFAEPSWAVCTTNVCDATRHPAVRLWAAGRKCRGSAEGAATHSCFRCSLGMTPYAVTGAQPTDWSMVPAWNVCVEPVRPSACASASRGPHEQMRIHLSRSSTSLEAAVSKRQHRLANVVLFGSMCKRLCEAVWGTVAAVGEHWSRLKLCTRDPFPCTAVVLPPGGPSFCVGLSKQLDEQAVLYNNQSEGSSDYDHSSFLDFWKLLLNFCTHRLLTSRGTAGGGETKQVVWHGHSPGIAIRAAPR